ncbi:MAG: cupin domain-containing protein [Deltaproteobacteria bacterium]|mgnify:FL=1|nr:cupin domain-containing protein [Deltaproteobacteria bacterium]
MKDENEPAKSQDTSRDFLTDASSQFGRRDQEKDFLDSITQEPPEKDINVNVGERVRKVRESRNLSLTDISQRTGLDTALLEQIEQSRVAPPLGTVIKLAKALDLKMGYFISGEESLPYTVVRRDDRKIISRYDSQKAQYYGYGYESLAPHKKDRHMEPFLVTLDPAETEEERSTHDGQEFIYVLEGTMEVRLDQEVLLLEPGDSIYYDSTVPHLVKCHGEVPTKILAVLYAEK